jgi:hypothetical protein
MPTSLKAQTPTKNEANCGPNFPPIAPNFKTELPISFEKTFEDFVLV